MAQSKKTTANKSTSSAAKKSSTGSRQKKSAAPAPPVTEPVVPIRRELGAVVFLFLSLFVFISYFKPDGAFILFFSNLMMGLVGWGYWLIAPVFVLAAVILAFHKGRPVAMRVFCAMLTPVLFAAMMSLMLYAKPLGTIDIRDLISRLFEQGQELESAGVLGGLIAIGLESAFSIYGALPVLLVCFVFCVVYSFRFNFSKVADKVKAQAHAQYDPAMYEDLDIPLTAEPKSAPKNTQKSAAKAPRQTRRTGGSFAMDIPLGEEDDVYPLDDRAPAAEYAVSPGRRGRSAAKTSATPEIEIIPMSADEAARIEEPEIKSTVRVRKAKSEKADDDNFKPISFSAEISDPPKNSRKTSKAEVEAEAKAVAEEISDKAEGETDYEFPPLSLLRTGATASTDTREEIALNQERLEGAIHSFGIRGRIVSVTRGPTVTRYDIELEQGVKLARVTNLAGDIALALGVVNVRIAPIPDKISTVGIEVPNKIVSTVYLRDIIESGKFQSAKSRLSFALGKDIGGDCIVGNIAKLPHMLIAGTTGSGKSVCMNSLILSLLYKARPEEVRLIMIDPKMVELGVYNGIPHLYVPVVTDPKKAAGALQWSVVEMLKRYRSFSEVGVRDLENYNRHCVAAGEPTMPQVVIVIDELADLMMVASKEVEESICRVAQMGRAAGMHLVIATQRPSADVITGLMKANIPSRIAFAVSSAMESRIILDQGGAEKLIGMGDMLFSPVGCGKPLRVQGAFVSDEEREDVIQFIKEGAPQAAEQNAEIEAFMTKAAEGKSADEPKSAKDEGPASEYDELLPKAVEAVLEMKSCSASMLQRRVKLGYSRAARIVDQMEELGIVGPYEGAKPRQVLIDREGWREIQRQLGLIAESELPEIEILDESERYDDGDEA